MFCKHCGKEVAQDAIYCPTCGAKLVEEQVTQQAFNQQQPVSQTQIVQQQDGGSAVGWGFLCWFVPIVGLILFLCWRESRPKVSKVCGICALVSFAINVVTSIFAWSFFWEIMMQLLTFESAGIPSIFI